MQRRAFAWVRPCRYREQDRPSYGEVWGTQALPAQARKEAAARAGVLRDGKGGAFPGGYGTGGRGAVIGSEPDKTTITTTTTTTTGAIMADTARDLSAVDTACPLVVHNNWVVGTEAKVYRFKEMRQWVVDSAAPEVAELGVAPPAPKMIPQGMVQPRTAPPPAIAEVLAISDSGSPAIAVWPPGSDGGYFSGSSRRYLQLEGDDPDATIGEQEAALRAAFTLASATGRVIIMPEFRCNKCRASPSGDGGCSPAKDRRDTHPVGAGRLSGLSKPGPGTDAKLARALALAASAGAYQYKGELSDADGCSYMAHWYVGTLSEHAK